MIPPIGKGTGTPLGIRLDQEASEKRDCFIDNLHALFPPCDHILIQRIRTVKLSQLHRSRIVKTHKEPDAVARKDLGHLPEPVKILFRDHIGGLILHIHVVDHRPVNPHAGHEPCIGNGALIHQNFIVIEEKGSSGVTALNAPVHVVPMIHHAKRHDGFLFQIKPRKSLLSLHPEDQGKNAVENPPLIGGLHHDAALFLIQTVSLCPAAFLFHEADTFDLPCAFLSFGKCVYLRIPARKGRKRIPQLLHGVFHHRTLLIRIDAADLLDIRIPFLFCIVKPGLFKTHFFSFSTSRQRFL